MRRLHRFSILGILPAVLFLSGCGPGQLFGPTFTPTPTDTPTPTSTPTPTVTPTPTSTPTITPTPIPGIGAPILVNEIGIIFTGVDISDYFAMGNNSYSPTRAADTFLIVDARIPEEFVDQASSAGIAEWDVKVNGVYPLVLYSSQIGTINKVKTGKMTWVFLVDEKEKTFILNFPGDVDFNLEPLL